ncbi:DUF429 domain-containing protein [Elioraea tepidiphila]|jgi:hypothetical protein|uniref:DUF429 domain-containing protein n=1 Tax=Elioraea tepidiphila TaxID=457934 RepID=UPI002FDAD8EF
MTLSTVYLGIDVACRKGGRLPLCVVSNGAKVEPLEIPKHLHSLVPRGVGNQEIVADSPFRDAARGVAQAIRQIATEERWHIERIAIDAPAAPPAAGARSAEDDLGRCGLSSFRTPTESDWPKIREACTEHLKASGKVARLPHANKIWMLFGFELFKALRQGFNAEIIEVYPFAIVRALLPQCEHKKTEQGYQDQLAAIACRTGWAPITLAERLKTVVPGSKDDRLDAFMSAWVASLSPDRRRAYGNPEAPDDAIWIPV